MTPVTQTLVGIERGNCLQACVASLLDLPIEQVPNFCEARQSGEWFEPFMGWLRERGWTAVYFKPPIGSFEPYLQEVYCIAMGPSPRGFWHATI